MPFEPAPKSSRAPSIVEFTVVEGPEAWKVDDYKGYESKYKTVLSESDIKELETAMEALDPETVDIKSVTKQQFPLPTLGPKLEAIQKEVTWGRGFALIKGLPVWRWTRRQSILAYWGIGLYWGKAGANNAKGEE